MVTRIVELVRYRHGGDGMTGGMGGRTLVLRLCVPRGMIRGLYGPFCICQLARQS